MCNFKGRYNIFPYSFYIGSVTKNFTTNETKSIALNCTIYDFSVDYGIIDKKYVDKIDDQQVKKRNKEQFLDILKLYLYQYYVLEKWCKMHI